MQKNPKDHARTPLVILNLVLCSTVIPWFRYYVLGHICAFKTVCISKPKIFLNCIKSLPLLNNHLFKWAEILDCLCTFTTPNQRIC
jgi:hypothetical protein